jgi:uncharacterized protein (TIGR02145 family)
MKPIKETYKNKVKAAVVSVLFVTAGLNGPALQAQVTIGSEYAPTRAALLELKTQQTAGALTSISDDANITSGAGGGGLLLPRVKLTSVNYLEPFIPYNDPDFEVNTGNLKERLAGLMVYNITNDGSLYPAVYTWNGLMWVTSQVNASVSSIWMQPKAFTFYETGYETIRPLTFTVSGDGTWTYQWYQLVGSNIHVRVAMPAGGSGGTVSGTGATTASFTPTGIKKTTAGSTSTRNANNTGFYRFYCVASSSLGAVLTSEVAEVAVGCGAKNLQGEWLSFMCFNLGIVDTIGISRQKNYSIGAISNDANGLHTYISGEENIWGSLFQWGRIADGHELRVFDMGATPTPTPTNILSYTSGSGMTASEIVNGNQCSSTDTHRPWQQVRATSNWYGKFIFGVSTGTNYNWNPVIPQTTADIVWRAGRFIQNDPCAHYEIDKTEPGKNAYRQFWHTGTTTPTASDSACYDSGTAWRIPSQDEWGSLYKGGTISGSSATAAANTWSWYNTNNIRGYEIKPDGNTTTLFLPASGYRSRGNVFLYGQGSIGYYWSTGVSGTNAYNLNFYSGTVHPATSNYRAFGFALRCIKKIKES